MRASLNYRETEGVTWALRTDQQVPIRTSSREWPSGTFSWSFAPPRSTLGRVLASVNAQLAYRTARTLAEQLGFSDVAGGAVTETTERTVRPLLALTWRQGISTAADAPTSTSDRLISCNRFHTEPDHQNRSLRGALKPPAPVPKLNH